MNSRTVLRLAAVLCLAVSWTFPQSVDATDWRIKIHHVSPDESEPEVPNAIVRGPAETSLEGRPSLTQTVDAPMSRPQNWLLRVLRILRSFNLGGLAR